MSEPSMRTLGRELAATQFEAPIGTPASWTKGLSRMPLAGYRHIVPEFLDDNPSSGPPRARAAVFATTHWSVVLAAAQATAPAAQVAMEQLCHAYWYPLYAHVRRRGHDHHRAEDLTQEFFARLLDQQWLNSVSPQKGRFRSFLLGALDHLMANEATDEAQFFQFIFS